MKKIISVFLSIIVAAGLCFGVASILGCKSGSPEKVKGKTLLCANIEYITFSTGYSDSYIGVTQDKDEIDGILQFFYDVDYKIKEINDNSVKDAASVSVIFGEIIIYLSVYEDGVSTVKKVNKINNATEYFSSVESSVDYDNLIGEMENYRSAV